MRGSSVRSGVALSVAALLGLGCAQMPQFLAAFRSAPVQLEAWGPGAVFPTIDAAAVDALTYAHLQGLATRSSERMRGGTIYRTGDGYSYGDLHVAGPLDSSRNRIGHALHSQDVARVLIYPRVGRKKADRHSEYPSQVDRRSMRVTDPLHRPLYILHPSLVIREYRGEDDEFVEVADLRQPAPGLLIAGSHPAEQRGGALEIGFLGHRSP